VRGFYFLIQHLCRFTGRNKKITIQPLKVAIDFFLPDNGLDPIDCCGVTFGGEPRALSSVQAFQVKVAIIERVDQVGRCA
jgi:hypothetical protein